MPLLGPPSLFSLSLSLSLSLELMTHLKCEDGRCWTDGMGNTQGSLPTDALETWGADDVARVLEPLGCAQFAGAVRGMGYSGAAVQAALVRELGTVQARWNDTQTERAREREARRLAAAAAAAELGEERRRRAEVEAEIDVARREAAVLAERLGAAQQECCMVRQTLAERLGAAQQECKAMKEELLRESSSRKKAEAAAVEHRKTERRLEEALAEARERQDKLERGAARKLEAEVAAREVAAQRSAEKRAVAQGEAAREAAETRFLRASMNGLHQAAQQLQEAKRALDNSSMAAVPAATTPSLQRQKKKQGDQAIFTYQQQQQQQQEEEEHVQSQVRAAAQQAGLALAAAQQQKARQQQQQAKTEAAVLLLAQREREREQAGSQIDIRLDRGEALMQVKGAAVELMTPLSRERSPRVFAHQPPPSPTPPAPAIQPQAQRQRSSDKPYWPSPYSQGGTAAADLKPRRTLSNGGGAKGKVHITARTDQGRARAPSKAAGSSLVRAPLWAPKGGAEQQANAKRYA